MLEGYFKNSILHGFARHFDAKGRLTFVAHYKNGIKHGVCWKVIRGGGVVVGRVNAQGKLSGMRIAYLYPGMPSLPYKNEIHGERLKCNFWE